MWTKASPLALSDADRATLVTWVRAHNSPQSLVLRSKIILAAADGLANHRIASDLGTTRSTVLLWRKRFSSGGPSALTEIAPGRGRKRSISPDDVAAVVDATLQTKPADATHWSTRSMAKEAGVSHQTVHRIWDAHNLHPHRVRTFKLSTDRQFLEKLTDVVGLYLNPPDKAVVLCVDEKSQIQALDRTQPTLPMVRGRCQTMTHDYKRNGTTTLFAALNVAEGTVFGNCAPRHRHQEFLSFLRRLDRELPSSVDLHLVLDNYGTHTHPKVREWLATHPRFYFHFTPTSCSWLNLVECWFSTLTRKRLKRGAFGSVPELIDAISAFIQMHNSDPAPFVWTASVQSILRKVEHCQAISGTNH
jgi:transposase